MSDVLRVVPPEPGRPGSYTKLMDASGNEVHGVSRVTVTFAVDEIVTAEITAHPAVDEIWAHPIMSEASFLEAARRYGYEVRKK